MKTYFPTVCCFFVSLLLLSCVKDHESALTADTCSNLYKYAYTDKLSYYPGETMKAFIQSGKDDVPCRLDIYTLTGDVAFSVTANLNVQTISSDEPSINGFGFKKSVDVLIPGFVRSGVYMIEKQTPFIVKSEKQLDVLVVYPSNTVNAYNQAGGKSLYVTVDRPPLVSFFRPMPLQANAIIALNWFSSLPNVEVGFIVDSDMDDYRHFANTRIVSIAGHSEYWTRKARQNFDKFVDAGGHAVILSGNTMWWQVRYTKENQLVCYRLSDPIPDESLSTINWTESSLQYQILPSIGADFPHGGYGLENDQGWDGYKIVAPDSPLLEGTGLKKGDIISLPSGEYDGVPLKGFDSKGYPVIDDTQLNFEKIELIGFDKGSRFNLATVGTFVVLKKTPTSGIIVNAASYDWCSLSGMGGRDGEAIKKITANAINKLLNNKPVFSK